ncbi:MAG: hypothetical protein LBU89_08845 [Fibromonadaceae bacterium]|nr:hypothetical protein [Fibromonadaceae bacterium]
MGKPVQHKEKKVESRLLDVHFLCYSLNKPLSSGTGCTIISTAQHSTAQHSTATTDKSKAIKFNFAFFQNFPIFYKRYNHEQS